MNNKSLVSKNIREAVASGKTKKQAIAMALTKIGKGKAGRRAMAGK